MIGFAIWRMTRRAGVKSEDKSDFVPVISTAQITTPETATLDPRTDVDETGGDI